MHRLWLTTVVLVAVALGAGFGGVCFGNCDHSSQPRPADSPQEHCKQHSPPPPTDCQHSHQICATPASQPAGVSLLKLPAAILLQLEPQPFAVFSRAPFRAVKATGPPIAGPRTIPLRI